MNCLSNVCFFFYSGLRGAKVPRGHISVGRQLYGQVPVGKSYQQKSPTTAWHYLPVGQL